MIKIELLVALQWYLAHFAFHNTSRRFHTVNREIGFVIYINLLFSDWRISQKIGSKLDECKNNFTWYGSKWLNFCKLSVSVIRHQLYITYMYLYSHVPSCQQYLGYPCVLIIYRLLKNFLLDAWSTVFQVIFFPNTVLCFPLSYGVIHLVILCVSKLIGLSEKTNKRSNSMLLWAHLQLVAKN